MLSTILSLDTSTRVSSVALRCNERTYTREGKKEQSHAMQLLPLIQELLEEANITYHNINKIIVTTGPGSFTGIRIGIATVRGLRLALTISCYGISTLEAMAYAYESENKKTIWSILPAGKGQIYTQRFCRQLNSSESSVALPELCYPEHLLAQSDRQDIWIGTAGDLLRDDARWDPTITAPHAIQLLCPPPSNFDYTDIVPFYIKPPDAKINRCAL